MLLDWSISFNYDKGIMAEAATDTGSMGGEDAVDGTIPIVENETPNRVERRQLELGITSRATLLTETRKRLTGPDGTIKEPTDEVEGALKVYLQISNKTAGGLDFGTEGNPLTLPAIDGNDQDGNPVHFDLGQAAVREIASVTEEGFFICSFSDEAGIPITKKVTDPTTGEERDVPVQIALPREAVLDAQFLSQRELYEGAVDGDQGKVLSAFADSLPQSGKDFQAEADLDPALENAAGDTGLPTATKIRDSINFKHLEPGQQEKLDDFMKNKTVLTAEDMRTVISFMGSDRLGVRREVKALLKSIGDLQERTDEVGQRELAEAQARLKSFEQLDSFWGKAESKGGTPYDSILQDIQDGKRTLKEAEAINNAILNGDFAPLFDTLPEIKNMSEPEKKMWLDYAKKKGAGAGWILAILLVLPAIAAGTVGYAGVSLASASKKG